MFVVCWGDLFVAIYKRRQSVALLKTGTPYFWIEAGKRQ